MSQLADYTACMEPEVITIFGKMSECKKCEATNKKQKATQVTASIAFDANLLTAVVTTACDHLW